eukprot:344253-Rhodomonas_salina.1
MHTRASRRGLGARDSARVPTLRQTLCGERAVCGGRTTGGTWTSAATAAPRTAGMGWGSSGWCAT